ncbi:hypothetical protein Ahia01_000761300 [Argonauta hians]
MWALVSTRTEICIDLHPNAQGLELIPFCVKKTVDIKPFHYFHKVFMKEFFVENLDKSHDASCFVMVDYPTSMEQLEAFEASIENDQIVVVVYLHLEDSQIILKCLKRLESSIRITRNIPALVALNIQIYKERFDEVLQHYKRFNRFIQIDSNAEHKYGDVVVRIRNLVRDTIYGRAEDGLPGSLKTKHAMVLASKYPMLGINSTGKNVTDPLAAGCCRWTNPATLIDGNQFEPMNQTVDLIHEMVKHAHSKGQIPILISYPKNLIQLQQFNDKIGLPSIVIHLKCTEEKAVKNLLSQCEETEYSIKNLLSITNGINCYEIHTVPVIKFYQTKSKLFTLETAHKSFEQVQYEIFEQIKVFLPECYTDSDLFAIIGLTMWSTYKEVLIAVYIPRSVIWCIKVHKIIMREQLLQISYSTRFKDSENIF